MRRQVIVFPGQRVIAKDGKIYVVAFERYGVVYAHGLNGLPVRIEVCGDAWGGEYDQTTGLAA